MTEETDIRKLSVELAMSSFADRLSEATGAEIVNRAFVICRFITDGTHGAVPIPGVEPEPERPEPELFDDEPISATEMPEWARVTGIQGGLSGVMTADQRRKWKERQGLA